MRICKFRDASNGAGVRIVVGVGYGDTTGSLVRNIDRVFGVWLLGPGCVQQQPQYACGRGGGGGLLTFSKRHCYTCRLWGYHAVTTLRDYGYNIRGTHLCGLHYDIRQHTLVIQYG